MDILSVDFFVAGRSVVREGTNHCVVGIGLALIIIHGYFLCGFFLWQAVLWFVKARTTAGDL